MNCPSCSTANRSEANFCRACGQRLPGRGSAKAVVALILAGLSVLPLLVMEPIIVGDWRDSDVSEGVGAAAVVAAFGGAIAGILGLLALRDAALRRVAGGTGLATAALVVVILGLLYALIFAHITLADACDGWRTYYYQSYP